MRLPRPGYGYLDTSFAPMIICEFAVEAERVRSLTRRYLTKADVQELPITYAA